MAYALEPFESIGLNEDMLDLLLAEHADQVLPDLGRLWCYYRNALSPATSGGGSIGAPAQSAGLPDRLNRGTGSGSGGNAARELVIENDIAWRIHTLVDYMFPQTPRLISSAGDPQVRSAIEHILMSVFDANGGAELWQNAALFGSIYGWVDFLVSTDGLSTVRLPGGTESDQRDRPGEVPSRTEAELVAELVRPSVVIETVEAPRAVALVNRSDYRRVDAYILHYRQYTNDVERAGWLSRLARSFARSGSVDSQRATVEITEIYSDRHYQRYENQVLVDEQPNRLGRVPIVHIQNLPQPLRWEGLSDVEPLIPLQDELNTRLSDRANRVTMQSFRMWLGKGIDGFLDRPVGPGQMWFTDNLDASIEAFGGDADSPSERAHIEELREAMDKASGVTPAAAGHIRARVGNLTSENALRISLMGTLAKIKRKRVTYGAGIGALCELILHALDVHGVFRTDPSDRHVSVAWSDPLPPDETRRIKDALDKAQLGVPLHVLRAELGYPEFETRDGEAA